MPISPAIKLWEAVCSACHLGKSFFTVLQDSPQEPPTCCYWPWVWSIWILSILVNMFLIGAGENAFSNVSRELLHSLSVGTAPHGFSTVQIDWPKAFGRFFSQNVSSTECAGSSQLKSLVETLRKGWQADFWGSRNHFSVVRKEKEKPRLAIWKKIPLHRPPDLLYHLGLGIQKTNFKTLEAVSGLNSSWDSSILTCFFPWT